MNKPDFPTGGRPGFCYTSMEGGDVLTYTKTYLVPEDSGWANGCLRLEYVESEEYHENEFYLWNNNTKSYDKVTDKECEIRLRNRKKLAPPTDCWIM